MNRLPGQPFRKLGKGKEKVDGAILTAGKQESSKTQSKEREAAGTNKRKAGIATENYSTLSNVKVYVFFHKVKKLSKVAIFFFGPYKRTHRSLSKIHHPKHFFCKKITEHARVSK